MIWVALIGAGTLVTLSFYQLLFTLYFAYRFCSWRPISADWKECPKVEIWMSLRGSDPDLVDNICGLLAQNYPHYRLRIIVDSRDDSSWHTVQEAIKRSSSSLLSVSVLEDRRSTCSLKCSAMAQLAKDLADGTEIVVMADGDIVAHPEWLHQLIAPFTDSTIGVVTGNRWFMPRSATLGSMVRYLWNSAAMVPTFLFANSWGGSCAIRARIFRETDLREKWLRAAVEDAPLKSMIQPLGLRCHFVPGIMMINREDCSLQFAFQFIARMFTWSRLYEPGFIGTIIHALVSTGALLSCFCLAIAGLLLNEFRIFQIAFGGLLIYHLGNLPMCAMIEFSIRSAIRRSGQDPSGWLTPSKILTLLIAMPLLELLYPLTVWRAWTCRSVQWRGIEYELRGPYDIHLKNDVPLLANAGLNNQSI